MLRVAMSSIVQSMLGCLPSEAFRVEVVDEMLAEFWEQVERHSRLEDSNTRICDLILELPSDRV
jgi:hypothetical protein